MIIPTPQNTKTITDLRERALELLAQTKKAGPTFILHRSKPRAVMLSIEEYSNMMEMLEDYFDSLRAKELEENPEKGGKTLEQLAKEHNITLQMYILIVRPRAERHLRKLPRNLKVKILKNLAKLRNGPFQAGLDVKKLAGTEKSYRLRVGELRVIYQVDTKVKEIVVVDIDFRRTTTY